MIHTNNIAFMGGIHGVGKTTLCKKLSNEVGFTYLSASDVLDWQDQSDKKVNNIPNTQDQLIANLQKIIHHKTNYIFDGHYCLINEKGESEPISLRTFRAINPFCLNILIGDTHEIQARLEKRDNKKYDANFLALMQDDELRHAKYLSQSLEVPLNILNADAYINFLQSIKTQMSA